MTRLLTLSLLLAAELPDNLPTVEASLREITARIDELEPESPMYERTHARLNDLLTLRERLLPDAASA